MGPKLEFVTRKCPKCGSDSVRDIEKLTGTGWAFVAAAVAVMLLATLGLTALWIPVPVVVMFFAGAAGLIGYARREHVYQSNRCRACSAEGTFDLIKVVQEPPPKA